MRSIIWLLFALCISDALAAGIGPALVYRVYEPGATVQLEYTVFSSADISVRGELSAYLDCPGYVSQQASIVCNLTMPAGLAAGPHEAEVVATERRPAEEGMITALPSAISLLRVDVPRPGKHVEARLEYKDSLFSVYVHNFGTDPIGDAYAELRVGEEGVETDHARVRSMSEAKLTARMMLPPGRHEAKATVHYDDSTISMTKEIVSGEPSISIQSINVDPFKPGEIARIRIKVMSDWPEPVSARGEVVVKANATQVLSTESFEILGDKEVSAYWESVGIGLGTYNATASIYYGDKVTSRQFAIAVEEVRFDATPLFVLIVGCLLGALIYLMYRARKPRKAPRDRTSKPSDNYIKK
jgi:hypothetical protein